MATLATQRFLQEITRSHEVRAYVDAVGPTGQKVRLTVTDGEVDIDRTANFRRSIKVNAIDPSGTLTPNGNAGVMSPFGTLLYPTRGVAYHNNDGTVQEELIPLGVFMLSKVTVLNSAAQASNIGITYVLEGYDLAREVSRDKFTAPYSIAAGTNVLLAIKTILARTFPALNYDAVDTPVTIPATTLYDVNTDPWTVCQQLATSMACEIYFNALGWVVVAPPPDATATTTPDFTYVEGPTMILTDIQSEQNDEKAFNGVVVTGSNTGDPTNPPVRATSWDSNPASPTYYLGPYGKYPTFIDDSNATTVAQCQAIADSSLKDLLGMPTSLTVNSHVNPAIQDGSIVQVVRAAMNISGLYIVDVSTIPLKSANQAQLILRQKQVIGSS